jgi:hypothetical protein
MPAGRPPIFSDPQKLQNLIDIYFMKCEDPEKPEHPTITGLALALGFCSRGTIYEYEKVAEFSDIIKTAMLKVENGYEKSVMDARNAAGPIFVLKNMGWKDKQEQEFSGGLQVTRLELPPKAEIGSPVNL